MCLTSSSHFPSYYNFMGENDNGGILMKQYIEKHICSNLIGGKKTLDNIISEYECVFDVVGRKIFIDIAPELFERTCHIYNLYDDRERDFVTYMRFYFDIDIEEFYEL